ncbi:MAG: hypothetical protein NVSMB64_18790 [Candidatus Velthaea sp.]
MIVRAAAVQLSPVLYSREGTIGKVLAAIDEAAANGAHIVVFPETVVPYYPYFSFIVPPVSSGADHLRLYEQAVTVPSPQTDAVASAARSHGIVVVLGVNERDHGTLYNTQLVFDADGTLALKRRKITPTFHERMIWGAGDGSGLKVVPTRAGRIGALACWEHYNPLARYALMAQHEEIHCSQFPGSLVGQIFADQMEVTIRHHALESGCFVINATAFLTEAQVAQIAPSEALANVLRGGCHTAIVSPEGKHLATPLTEGEGAIYADLDFTLITKRKRMMDSVGHYARPELLSLLIDSRSTAPMHQTSGPRAPAGKPFASLERDGVTLARVSFPPQPRFYSLSTFDGIPYWKIATLHGNDVLATTVLQDCIRYANRRTSCQFCAIGESLRGGRTIAHKSPEQLAEVTRAAVILDGVKHVVLTTGTPNGTDRGARVLTESAAAIRAAIDVPIQAQCEPPDDFAWFERLRAAGVDTLGMHLEAVEPGVRARVMPGKAKVPVSYYLEAFKAAVRTFGRGQVSTYILAGLGDASSSILEMSRQLIDMGVYPFVVPLVPIGGTPLEHAATPGADVMQPLLAELGSMLRAAGLLSADIKAGCGKCGACSTLSVYES